MIGQRAVVLPLRRAVPAVGAGGPADRIWLAGVVAVLAAVAAVLLAVQAREDRDAVGRGSRPADGAHHELAA